MKDKEKNITDHETQWKKTNMVLLKIILTSLLFIYFLPFLGLLSRHMGGSQARGLNGAVATGPRQSHSNMGSEPSLQPTPQLTATPDRQPTEQGQGSNPQPHGS